MILDKEIEISLTPSAAVHYGVLGYIIPKYQWKSRITGQIFKKMKVKRGARLIVKVKDLPEGSSYKIKVCCDDCGKIRIVRWQSVISDKALCAPCATTRKCYSGGLPKCIQCGEKVSSYANISGYCQRCYRGENTLRWNLNLTGEFRLNGRSVNPKYYEWRNKVFERDMYTCKKCGDDKGGNLNAHHIENFSNNGYLRTDIDNGITLCEKCHKSFHLIFGYFDNNREQINSFFNHIRRAEA